MTEPANFEEPFLSGDEYRRDPRTPDQLADVLMHSSNEAERAEASLVFRFRASRVDWEFAVGRLGSDDPEVRSVAAMILGEFGVPVRAFERETVAALKQALEAEEDPDVRGDLVSAVAHHPSAEAEDILLSLLASPDEDIRHNVALGLAGRESARALDGLVTLTRDEDQTVRNWATFGLGRQSDADSEEIRQALLRNAADADPEIRGEAMLGLARRRDPRVTPLVAEELLGGMETDLPVEAAWELADPSLCDALAKLLDEEIIQFSDPDLLPQALDRCRAGVHDARHYDDLPGGDVPPPAE